MTGHDLGGREPARRRATAKPMLGAVLRKPRLSVKTVSVCAAALSVTSATALIAAGCNSDDGSIHASGAVATAASAAGKAASAAAGAAARAAVAGATAGISAGAGTGSSAAANAAPGSLAPSASASASASTSASSDPGLLPQTRSLPDPADPQFQAGVQSLWQAIVQGNPALAHGFFFPLSAYRQVKALSDPAADYQSRLLAWYDLDIKAAHDQLGPGAATAKLVSVQVPTAQAQWIAPGVEFNKGSYYRVYGTRLVYQENGRTASFGIFSLISWRGQWYVVHLGPSVRSSMRGIVYEPEG